jgi:metacaspase-1
MPKGISLHIGINSYNNRSYSPLGMRLPVLPNCNRDAIVYYEIAKRFRYDPAILTDKDATAEQILLGIEIAARYLECGDKFFVTFSGHGTHIHDFDQDEDDARDEAWCCYDKLIIDDELYARWKLFRPGVRILVIADSCHSGTSTKDPTKPVISNNKLPRSKIGYDLQATVLLLAACQDAQIAYGGSNILNSLYTHWMLKVIQTHNFCRNYRELHRMVHYHMPGDSKPKLYSFGPEAAAFEKSRPFLIGA